MNRRITSTITDSARRCAFIIAPALLATALFAHGGFDHVMGTIEKVSGNTLTVKTTKGDVDVKLDDKTELTKNNAKAAVADLEHGARVIVDIPEGNKEHLAHSVKIGVVAAPAAHDHDHDAHK
jgi:Domain of unknown function (DUF5666)